MISDKILKKVSKPGRYIGGEYGQILKNKDDIKARWAFCFPDTYEIGMSNLGMRILYGSLNSYPDIWCERCYTPWEDMQVQMKENNIPLYALESGDALDNFDFVAFTLQYELCYTNVLTMLDLAGIPLMSADRGEEHPIVIGGGPCAYNAEPVADFFDVFSIGEGEEALPEITRLYIEMKDAGTYTREAFLHEAAKLEGFYVPSLYEVSYNEDGSIREYTPKYGDIPAKIKKRIIEDMDKAFFPEKVVMPYIETVHDRIMLEVCRGCYRGCRFCQAGNLFRPVRRKSVEVLNQQAKTLYENCGYDEMSLTSLSISDYPYLEELCDTLLCWTEDKKVSMSLPSLRIDSFSKELMDRISSVRSSGLTFAPEAGTQRLRDVINKGVCEEDLMNAAKIAFGGGKSLVKLYFMLGLPTETNEDLEGIALMAEHVLDAYYTNPDRKKGSKPPQVTISVASFIPKPFTPFQWEPQDDLDTLLEKQKYLGSKITNRKIKYNWHEAKVSRLEAVFARGDRRLSKAILEAHKQGMMFDSWDEYFNYEKWMEVFKSVDIDPSFYANRRFGDDEVLPWDIIDIGVTKSFLLREKKAAYEERPTPNCVEKCSGCGADKLGGKNSCCPKQQVLHPESGKVQCEQITRDKVQMTPEAVRIKFEKMNVLKFISHLDVTRTMKTALTRAGIPVWYTEGFNPHVKMIFSLPLSIGTESVCEYMDIKITEHMSHEEIKRRLGAALTSDMAITEVYTPKMKFQDIAYALYEVTPYEAYDLSPLEAERIMVKKHSKKGEIEIDLKERIKSIEVRDGKIIILGKADQLNYLNPEQVMALTGCTDHRIIRKEVYNERMQIFR